MGQEISVGSNQELEGMKKYAGFSPGQVEMIREKFDLMADEDLSLNKEQFSKLMKVSEKEADKIFDHFDIDQSGRIDSYEFICGLALLSQANIKQKAELIFNLYDFDKNRTITQNELVILVKTTMTSLNVMAQRPEATIQEAETKCKEILSKYDTNKDGTISLKEFQSFISKDSDILKMLHNYGLISKEDLRPDFGGSEDMPEADSDLENEIFKALEERDERIEKIKNGIEHTEVYEDDVDENLQKKKKIVVDEGESEAPWQKTIKLLQPSDYKPTKGESNPPCAHLDIDYVHGYRCHDTRNNIKYNSNGEIIYPTASIGIKLESNSNTQDYYLEHNDDIVCLDAYENTIVTGQLGYNPLICVWDSVTMQSKVVFRGVLKNGIGNVCFSNDGKKIAAAALDEEHTVAIYDLEKAFSGRINPQKKNLDEGLLATGKITRAPIFDMRFDLTDKLLIIACLKEIYFVSFDYGQIKKTKGVWDKQNTPQSVLSIGFLESNVITGMFKGQLLVWKGNRLQQTIQQAHAGPITAMCTKKSDKKGIITGGRDGVILVWDNMMKIIQKHELREFRFYNPRVVAICEDVNGKIAIGTRSSEIAEIVVSKHKTVVKGHWEGELWGLTVHTKQGQYFTVGEENLLACWDIKKKIMLLGVKLDFPAKALHMSSNGKYLAVGCMNGSVLIVDPKSLVVTFTFKDRDKDVSCIKFSPDNELLAVAYGHPSCEVLIYSVRNHFKNDQKLRGSTSRVTHMDFSKDNKILMCNNQRFELLFFDLNLNPAKIHTKPENLKDEKWETFTCILGWHVQGIWPPCSQGLDINSVDRSNKGDIIVTGDDFSKVKLFRYPAAKTNASYIKYSGHAAQVTNVRFSFDSDYIVSTGGHEKSIIQWKFNFDNAGQIEQDDIYHNAQDDEEVVDQNAQQEDSQSVKHFMSQIGNSTPSSYKPSKKDNQMPNNNLQLSYVCGFKCFDKKDECRNMVKYLGSGRVVFTSAAIGVIMDPKNPKQQLFFSKHKEEIVSLSIHPKGTIVATGQQRLKGDMQLVDIFIWETDTRQILGHINDFHRKGISQLEFSPDGGLLMTAGQDEDNSLAVYDWLSSRIIATSKVDRARVNSIAWKNQSEFVTVGSRHIKFWTLQGRNLKSKIGTLQKKHFEGQTCAVFAFAAGICITGGIEGNLYVWQGTTVQSTVNAHTGKIGSMVAKQSQLITGGYDGKVIVWQFQNGLQKANEIVDLTKIQKDFDCGIVSLDFKNDNYLIGTKGNQIYEMKFGQQPTQLAQGHYEGEVWGLATSPKEYQFVTCGGDKVLRLWDLDTKKQLCVSKPFEAEVRAVDWSQNGQFLVAGDIRANIYVYQIKQSGNPPVFEFIEIDKKQSKFSATKKQGYWIEDIKIAPDNAKCAFGAHGGSSHVEVYEILAESQFKFGKGQTINAGLTSGLTHLDWSQDSQTIIVNSSAYELKFVSIAQKGKDVSASATRDHDWFTWTCTLGWFSQGIFPNNDGLEVNACVRNNFKTVIATGNDYGRVNLFQYPVCIKKQVSKTYGGHSSRVTRLRFTYDDKYLITLGGNDRTVLIWDTDISGQVNQEELAHDEDEKAMEEEEQKQQGGEEEIQLEYLQERKKKYGGEKFGKGGKKEKKGEEDEGFNEEADKGEDFSSVRPWQGHVKEPTYYYKDPLNQHKQPPASLNLDFIFGYKAKECKSNIKYLKNGGIVYFTAAVGVVMDATGNIPVQKFFTKHTDEITCLDINPDGVKVATGQLGQIPTIFVWDSNTLVPLCTFKGQLTRGISSIAFSLSGDKLAAVAIDQQHEIAVFDITAKSKNGGVLLAKEKGGTEVIQELVWKNDAEFASAGLKHFKVWTQYNTNLKAKKGVWGKQKASRYLNCIANNGDDYVCGVNDGTLQIWKGNILTSIKTELHKKSIDCITSVNTYIITGGKDMKINILDKNYNTLLKITEESIMAKKEIASFSPEIKAVHLSSDNKSLVLGTMGGEIYEMNTKDAKLNTSTKYTGTKRLMASHYQPNKKSSNELWGLSTYSNDNDLFSTCSDDGTLRVWSIQHKRVIKQSKVNTDDKGQELALDHRTQDLNDMGKARSVAISPDGEYLVVGFKDGVVKIFDKELNQKNFIKVAKELISDIKFSPNNGELLAIGSHDNAIYIYTFPEMKSKCKPMRKHSSYISHFDFSVDGQNLHSNCGAFELLFWDVNSGKQIQIGATQFRDERWATLTTPLSWPTQGIWPEITDSNDINCSDRTHQSYSNLDTPPDNFFMIACGEDNSSLKIYRYPCVKKNSAFLRGVGHSSNISNVRWSNNDEYLISTGSEDNSIFIWKVTKQ